MPVIWKAPSPTMTSILRLGIGHAGPDGGGHAETHRRVIGGAQEFGVALHLEVGRPEQRVADVGNHGHIRDFAHELIEPAEEERRR